MEPVVISGTTETTSGTELYSNLTEKLTELRQSHFFAQDIKAFSDLLKLLDPLFSFDEERILHCQPWSGAQGAFIRDILTTILLILNLQIANKQKFKYNLQFKKDLDKFEMYVKTIFAHYRPTPRLSHKIDEYLKEIKGYIFSGILHLREMNPGLDLYEKLSVKKSVRELLDAVTYKVCPICLNVNLTEDTNFSILGTCDHIFCKRCTVKWFSIQKTCPMCRKIVLAKTYTRSFVRMLKRRSKEEAAQTSTEQNENNHSS